MNVEELKTIWKNDMNTLEKRIHINEQKIQTIEFNKAQSSFDQLLKVSILGKNMALVYAAVSVISMTVLTDAPLYLGILALGAGLMVFSYFQHSVLKKVDYGKLSVMELQKKISQFRIHTSRTAVYDVSIVVVWMITFVLAALKIFKGWDVFENLDKLTEHGIILGVLVFGLIFSSKYIYADYDKKLKQSEEKLSHLEAYERN